MQPQGKLWVEKQEARGRMPQTGQKIDYSGRQHAARLTLRLTQSAFRMLRRSLAETSFKLFGDCVVAFPGREWKA